MLQLSRLSRCVQLQIKSSCKNEWTMILWSRNYSCMDGPMKLFYQKIDTGELKPDEHQTKVMNELQTLYDTIQTYKPPEIQLKNTLLKLLPITKRKKQEKNNAPKGLYIYGSVGGGKTTLMDIFFNSCQTVNCVIDTRYQRNNNYFFVFLNVFYFPDSKEETNSF